MVYGLANLTLTSVVFELCSICVIWHVQRIFNFNKCCIWIILSWFDKVLAVYYLTLTSVVFESNEASAIDMCVKI